MLAEEPGDFGLRHQSGCDIKDNLLVFAFTKIRFVTISIQKHQSCNGSHPLIAVNKGMVLNKVKQVRGGHLKYVLM